MALDHRREELQCYTLVACLGGNEFQNFARVFESRLQIMPLAVDFHKHLVEVPAPLGILPHAPNALPADFSGEHAAVLSALAPLTTSFWHWSKRLKDSENAKPTSNDSNPSATDKSTLASPSVSAFASWRRAETLLA